MASNQPSQNEITQLLNRLRHGEQRVLDELVPVVYQELRNLASAYLRKERSGHTLSTTALVNEAYLRLVGQDNLDFENRAHFFGVAAKSMRQILIEYARKIQAAKRGKGEKKISIEEIQGLSEESTEEILALDEALTALENFDDRKARIVELRYFTGLTIEETAEVMNISPATIKRDWNLARAWLFREISSN